MAFRILTLDGGGTWLLIEIRALIDMFGETARGHDVLGVFDMVAATSGGSLVLAGLVENLSLGELLALIKDHERRASLFPPTRDRGDRVLSALTGLGPKYSAAAKLPAIGRLLPATGRLPLAGITRGIEGPGGRDVHLLVVAFDYDRNTGTYFRSSATAVDFGADAAARVSLAEAVHASSNAPVDYFDAPATLPCCPGRYWDGALTGNNNPALVAAVEAVALGHAPADLRILSLGTATVRRPLAAPGAAPGPCEIARPDPSLPADLRKLATAILDDPPDFATFVVHAMTGGAAGVPKAAGSRIVRMSPLVSPLGSPGAWTLPPGWSPARFDHLASLGLDAVADADLACIDDWASLWLQDAVRNQPIRMNGDTFAPEPGLGQATYGEAKRAWQALVGATSGPPPPDAGAVLGGAAIVG